ncbi:hypothetical protein EDEG_01709 [Edhazardia aedis USNM 41457]|uniref:Uncharacterized protein n=1 Tax=Edhazardia aedis (strain USNM 41457) TaxID=1003232 RepID=J8ZWC6_EDHAE|nr:hypothetical protein EDEG_01709 [Edhazardia aedis USNM 41457]|eukprot:EJW03998.1 hypothetical protein EDEG_01709 [Edhazardia aedis USNM 41457]
MMKTISISLNLCYIIQIMTIVSDSSDEEDKSGFHKSIQSDAYNDFIKCNKKKYEDYIGQKIEETVNNVEKKLGPCYITQLNQLIEDEFDKINIILYFLKYYIDMQNTQENQFLDDFVEFMDYALLNLSNLEKMFEIYKNHKDFRDSLRVRELRDFLMNKFTELCKIISVLNFDTDSYFKTHLLGLFENEYETMNFSSISDCSEELILEILDLKKKNMSFLKEQSLILLLNSTPNSAFSSLPENFEENKIV